MCQLSVASAVGNRAKGLLGLGQGVGVRVATVVWYSGKVKGASKRGCGIPWAVWRLGTGTWLEPGLAGAPRKLGESLGIRRLDIQGRERDSRQGLRFQDRWKGSMAQGIHWVREVRCAIE